MTKWMLSWGMVLSYVVLNACGALLIKHKINEMGPFPVEGWISSIRYFQKLFFSFQIMAGFGAIFASALAWMIALSRLELSTAYPVAIGLNFGIIFLFSLLFFQESLTFHKSLGLLLLLSGFYFLTKA